MKRYVSGYGVWSGTGLTGIVVLFEVCADKGDEFQLDVHMPRAKGPDEGGSDCGVCELWV